MSNLSGYLLPWTETEEGWGTRPDGYSLHRTMEEMKDFCMNYRRLLEKEYGDTVPEIYSYPEHSQVCNVEINSDKAQLVIDACIKNKGLYIGTRNELNSFIKRF